MALERHDFDEAECLNEVNSLYFERYTDWIAPKCQGEVLDIGCGCGYLSEKIAQNPNVTKVYCTDKLKSIKVNHEKIQFKSVRTEKLIMGGTFGQNKKFDTIVCTEHIEHLPEEQHLALLLWVKKHLNGVFMGSMPERVSPTPDNPYHLKEYTPDEWKNVITRVFPEAEVIQIGNLYVWQARN